MGRRETFAMRAASYFIGTLYYVVLIIPATFLLFHWAITIPLFLISPRLHRVHMRTVQGVWFSLPVVVMMYLCPMRFYYYGDVPAEPLPDHTSVIVANHLSRSDWLWLWPLCARIGSLGYMRIVLKDLFAATPTLGWWMSEFMFIFLRRERRRDIPTITNALRAATTGVDSPACVIIFPEGTDRSAGNLAKSQAHAKASNLPVHEKVLVPHTLGLQATLEALPAATVVYDVTLAYNQYPSSHRTTEMSVCAGRVPLEVHLHVRRVDAAEVRRDTRGWLAEAWARKEAALAAFDASAAQPRRSFAAHFGAPQRGGVGGWDATYIAVSIVCWLGITALAFAALAHPLPFWVMWAAAAFHILCTVAVGGWAGLSVPYILWRAGITPAVPDAATAGAPLTSPTAVSPTLPAPTAAVGYDAGKRA